MAELNRIMTNICSSNLEASRDFYTGLFNFNIGFESDWFIHLVMENKSLELGIIDQDHEMVPEHYQTSPAGFYITFVVKDVEEYFTKAKLSNYEIVSEPTDTFYGQRRLLLKDPDGTLIDISAPIKDFKF